MLLILAALSLQAADPAIEEVEQITGEARRPYLWTPLAVTLSSQGGFKGDLVCWSGLGVRFSRPVEVAPSGRVRVLLPAVDPLEVSAGASRRAVPPARPGVDLLAGVDGRLEFTGELASTDRMIFRRLGIEDLRELLALGLMEAFDVLLLADSADLGLEVYSTTGAWCVPRGCSDAEEFLRGAKASRSRVPAVDERLWRLEPRDGWIPAKKTFTLFFATLYAFSGFVALVLASRRGFRVAVGSVVVTSALFTGAYAILFPRGQLWVMEYACEIVSPRRGAAEWSAWFAGSPVALDTRIEFPRLVKPVFASAQGAPEPFEIRLQGHGCEVRGLKLSPGGLACFVGASPRASSLRGDRTLSAPLYRPMSLLGNRFRSLGDFLPEGSPLPKGLENGDSAPQDPSFTILGSRFVSEGCVFGWLDRDDRAARDVRSPDLCDARERPRFMIQHLR